MLRTWTLAIKRSHSAALGAARGCSTIVARLLLPRPRPLRARPFPLPRDRTPLPLPPPLPPPLLRVEEVAFRRVLREEPRVEESAALTAFAQVGPFASSSRTSATACWRKANGDCATSRRLPATPIATDSVSGDATREAVSVSGNEELLLPSGFITISAARFASSAASTARSAFFKRSTCCH